jgi:hypothetical protein
VRSRTEALRSSFPEVVWHFDFNDRHFSRSAAINTGLLRSTRPCVCAYDTDVLLDPEALRSSAHIISSGRWPIVIPFNLIFVELSGALRKRVIDSLDISGLSTISRLSAVPKHPEIASRVLSGAVMMCDRDLALRGGGYNRKMVSYGWEDIEFFKRFEKMGHYSVMLKGFNLIHLDHRRGPDSRINEMYEINKREFDRVRGMSEAALRMYVERELRIAPVEADRRGHPRGGRSLNGALRFRRAAHIANKVATIWRINGLQGLLRKAFRTQLSA